MDKWSNDWILDNADEIFDEDFVNKIYNIFHRKYGITQEDAKDLTGEVISDKLYSAIRDKKFKGSSEKEFWGYIRGIARNTKNDYWEEQNLLPEPIPEIFSSSEDKLIFVDPYKTPVEDIVIINETLDMLADNLTPAQLEVLKYTAMEMKSPEISKIVDKSEGAVRKLRERGRETARKLFDGDPMDGFKL